MSERELRDELIDRLAEYEPRGVYTGTEIRVVAEHVIDHLLPVVRRAVDQARADERERIAWEIEQARPHVPPSHNQSRRERVVQRSTLTQAARIARGGDPDA